MAIAAAVLSAALFVAALCAASEAPAAPFAWAYLSSAVWTIWLISKSWNALHFWDKVHLLWGAGSIAALCNFTHGTALAGDPFEGWGDVYFFCGSDYRYCRCDFTWNFDGWVKALVIWSFVVTACLGMQKLVIHIGLNGLLPGEEVVTKESLVSFCWRLIPYWLNSWEQQWGAECSSVMFELPHFALELLVVLPCVQIMSSRLKILLMPAGRGLVPPFDQTPPEEAANMAPVIITGLWEERKADQAFQGRLRANLRVLTLIVGISSLAAFNALYVPLHLEKVIHTHPRSIMLLAAARASNWQMGTNTTLSDSIFTPEGLAGNLDAYICRGCERKHKLLSNLNKHALEIARMQSLQYQDLTMCVEAALTIMRLSCEQYFTLISVFAAYLFFRQRPPLVARRVIWLNHRVSTVFKKAILYSFPAICWLYGAGLLFSSFASLVFWGQPAAKLWEKLRTRFTTVIPVGLQDANEAQIEQMNGNCAVCWSSMSIPGAHPPSRSPSISEASPPSTHSGEEEAEVDEHHRIAMRPQGFMEVPFNIQSTQAVDPLVGAEEEEEDQEDLAKDPCKALPCGHAFHDSCIAKWLAQCHAQSRKPTCPMCNLVIQLEVSYQIRLTVRWPWGRAQQPHRPQDAAASADDRDSAQTSQQQQQQQHHQTGSPPAIDSFPLSAPPVPAAAHMGTDAHQHHQHNLAGTWRHHAAVSAGEQPPQQQSSIGDWYHVPATSAADDSYPPTHASLSPQLAQERFEAAGQSHALPPFRSNHMRGFAASAWVDQTPSSSSAALSDLWGRGYAADSPIIAGQTAAGSGHMEPALATLQEASSQQRQFAEQEQQQGYSQDAVVGQPQGRRLLRRSFSPASMMHRMLGKPHRNHRNDAQAHAGSNGGSRVPTRTDLTDASAMRATS